MSSKIELTKENINKYLLELSKEFRKLNGRKTPAEIILIGGASILINYGFRESTQDIDAIISASSAMKEAINNVGDRLGLPTGWLNADFVQTASYSPKLIQHSKYYRTFSNILSVRTVSSEYLVAMKLMSGRQYKHDLSDVIGILLEQQRSGKSITLEQIKSACTELYGDFNKIPLSSQTFINDLYKNNNLEDLFSEISSQEKSNRSALIQFEKDYPSVLNNDNFSEILEAINVKKRSKQ